MFFPSRQNHRCCTLIFYSSIAPLTKVLPGLPKRTRQPLVESCRLQKAGPAAPAPEQHRQPQVELRCLYLRPERSAVSAKQLLQQLGWLCCLGGGGRGTRQTWDKGRCGKDQATHEPVLQPCPALPDSQAAPTPPWTNTPHTVGCSHLSTSWCHTDLEGKERTAF